MTSSSTSSPGDLADGLAQSQIGVQDAVARLAALDSDARAAALTDILRSYSRKTRLLAIADALGSQLELGQLIAGALAQTRGLLQADRTSLFMLDRDRNELWSRVAEGMEEQEIRFPADKGIAGAVAMSGETLNLADAYEHADFNQEIDRKSGYRTKSMLTAPIRNKRDEVVGVLQAINRVTGTFDRDDEETIEDLGRLLAPSLEASILYQETLAGRKHVDTLLDVANSLSKNLDLTELIQTIMERASALMHADRATLFLLDHDTNELWSRVAQGMDTAEIRFPATVGIAGHVATTGETLNIPDAYEHELFNDKIDKETGYRTKSILCAPIRNNAGVTVGVTQLINKENGIFTAADERLLGAFSAQAAIAIENATLYASVSQMRDHLESVLESLSNGVITLDGKGRISTVNRAARTILHVDEDTPLDGLAAETLFGAEGDPVMKHVLRVKETGQASMQYDVSWKAPDDCDVDMNVNVVPFIRGEGAENGVVIAFEDITKEKRVRSSLTRYMSADIAEQLIAGDTSIGLGGVHQEVTIIFSDIRQYTALTERSGAHEIVTMLNEYFTYMVDAIFKYGGVLDKFIGDAIMAVFGAPFAHPRQDPLNACNAALEMKRLLEVYNEEREAAGRMPIKVGIGIATGAVLCGNIGSEKRMDYTAIGDAVNLASRLEGATKQYGVELLVSERTHMRLQDGYRTREVDVIRVKGKTEPVKVFELLGSRADPIDDDALRQLELHEDGMRHYRGRRWVDAMEAFSQAAEAAPDQKLPGIYLERCRHFLHEPPPADWDGVWTMTSK